MTNQISDEDRAFQEAFERHQVAPAAFDHTAHVRLAYVYLAQLPTDRACERMAISLRSYLAHLGLGEGKYHETLTRAWVSAVAHFMSRSANHDSAEAFLAANPTLLDRKIMLTHYSADLLFSDAARRGFIPADIDAIPETEPGGSAPT